jgi:tetratricopeptide (TPR) repeat protein
MTLIQKTWRWCKDAFFAFTARVLLLCGNEESARKFFLRQLAHRTENYGTSHPKTAYAMVFVAQTFPSGRAVDREKQERLLTAALLIFNKSFGPVSTEAAYIRHRLGFLHYKAGKLVEAISFYEEADQLYRQADTPWSLNHADLLDLWAIALQKQGGNDFQVSNCVREAKVIRVRFQLWMSRSRRIFWMKYRR